MNTILVADDDRDLLRPVCKYISKRDKGLRTLAASSGSESIELLESEQVDVVLSDLRMPCGDGIDILAYLSSRVPPIPVILMSGYVQSDAAEALSRFGRLRFLSKPAPLHLVYEAVQQALKDAAELGSFSGFSLAGILQLVEMEGKSCMVVVRGGDRREGYFIFSEGTLQAALCGDLTGPDGALEMLSWTGAEVKVRALPEPAKGEEQGGLNVTGLLMRAVQLHDENSSTAGTAEDAPGSAGAPEPGAEPEGGARRKTTLLGQVRRLLDP